MAEKLVGPAIIRDGVTHKWERGSHYQIRQSLGDSNPQAKNLNDEEGFWTSENRFVDRDGARQVALKSGQIGKMWERGGRELLSSDVDW